MKCNLLWVDLEMTGLSPEKDRILDDIVDLELEKIEQILQKVGSDPEGEDVKLREKNLWKKIARKSGMGRRTGVGITAEGDMLAALGLRYGTKEATDFSISVHRTLALAAYGSSVQMAKERGAFEVYDAKREEQNPFVLRLKEESPELYDEMVKYGRRNIACLTIAPTGTTCMNSYSTRRISLIRTTT